MMKGYLTVFLSLSLSIFIGFILLLAGAAIGNAERIRIEGAADAGMNSVLGEFHIGLHDRYGLIYVDASYLDKKPSIANVEDRLAFYIRAGMTKQKRSASFGEIHLTDARVTNVGTAVDGMGNSMKYQAVCYIQRMKDRGREASVDKYLASLYAVDGYDALEEWGALQEQIAGMELPLVLNEKGEWEEVPLGNPADAVFGLTGSDLLYLLEVDNSHTDISVSLEEYISGRVIENAGNLSDKQADDLWFLSYLFDQMGRYRAPREDSLLQYQLEYIAQGRESDYKNLKAVAEKLMQWRFAQNADYALNYSGLYGEAWEMAGNLYAVVLKPEFHEPVTKSILYACAYLETLSELKCLMSGGEIDVGSDSFHAGVDMVVSGSIPSTASVEGNGIIYEEYLACMLLMLPEYVRNLRSMDIMEMDIRFISGNPYFSMDWCIERYTAQVLAEDSRGREYEICRTYGYY